jgi:transcriptional regulator with XRE-family HTH domain
MPSKTKSARADGRGGWIPGKRRHPDGGDWAAAVKDLRRLREIFPRRRDATHTALARDLGVTRKTISRWRTGEDRPSPAMQARVKAWLRKHAYSTTPSRTLHSQIQNVPIQEKGLTARAGLF